MTDAPRLRLRFLKEHALLTIAGLLLLQIALMTGVYLAAFDRWDPEPVVLRSHAFQSCADVVGRSEKPVIVETGKRMCGVSWVAWCRFQVLGSGPSGSFSLTVPNPLLGPVGPWLHEQAREHGILRYLPGPLLLLPSLGLAALLVLLDLRTRFGWR